MGYLGFNALDRLRRVSGIHTAVSREKHHDALHGGVSVTCTEWRVVRSHENVRVMTIMITLASLFANGCGFSVHSSLEVRQRLMLKRGLNAKWF